MMKICIDCKHFIEPVTIKVNTALNPFRKADHDVVIAGAKCGAVVNLTFGEPASLSDAREDEQKDLLTDVCGRDGKYWEAK